MFLWQIIITTDSLGELLSLMCTLRNYKARQRVDTVWIVASATIALVQNKNQTMQKIKINENKD